MLLLVPLTTKTIEIPAPKCPEVVPNIGKETLKPRHFKPLEFFDHTGLTCGKKPVVLIGQKKALAIAVRNDRPQRRYSGLHVACQPREVTDKMLRSLTPSC